MTYKEILEEKKNAHVRFRDEIRKVLDNMGLSTYYSKLEKNKFKPAEKRSIANHLGRPAEELFPENG